MYKKLTITVEGDVYQGLYDKIGARKISGFINKIVKEFVVDSDMEKGYMQMAKDNKRENEAEEWSNNLITDVEDEER